MIYNIRACLLGVCAVTLLVSVSAAQVTISGGVAMSGGVTTSGSGTSSGSWSDNFRKTTLAVGQVTKDEFGLDHFQTGGVAVLISDGRNRFFIATAKHVFDNPSEHWAPESLQFRGWKDEQTSRYRDFGARIVLRQNGKNLFTASSDFDLAVIPATEELLTRIELDGHKVAVLQPTDFADAQTTSDGEDVVVLGFPALVGEEYQQRALMRSGIVAWTDSSGPTNHEFLIDARIFPGNSGGPVFSTPAGVNRDASISTGRVVKLLGLVSKTVNAKPDVAFGIRLPENGLVIGAAGVGIIEPAQELIKLMDKAESEQQ
jgi:hypothetical protein